MQREDRREDAGQASALQDAPLVDTHAHIYRRDMPMAEAAWHRPPADASLEAYLSTLDEAGVHFGILAAASIYGDYNDYMIEAVRRHERLRATVIVSPDIDPYTLRRMKDDGVVGIRFQFRNVESPPDLSGFEYQRLLRRIADLDWHVHLHDEGDRLLQHIAPIEKAGARLAIDHFGRPVSGQGAASAGFRAVLEAVERGRTWVKISAAFRLDSPAVASELTGALLHHAGPERLLWGSDWPFAAFEDQIDYAAALAQYHANVPDAATRRAIDRTALKFYFG